MPGRKKNNSRWNYLFFWFSFPFPFLPCTKPFWDTGSWSTVYMTPRFLYILLFPGARLRETTGKGKKKRKKEKARTPLVLSIDFFFSFLCFCCLPDSLFYSLIWHLPIFISIIIRSVSISVHLIQFSFQNTVHSYTSTTQTHTQDTYNRPCHLSWPL